MPGILPMKVIKVGSSSQSRVAQACDRCRSKKIKCDGIRPSCTQCVNVGFECRTSDKLSRRAFPRGYTESLEANVRTLQAEVNELKELLDKKDEKIDILSHIHGSRCRSSFEPTSRAASVAAHSPAAESGLGRGKTPPKEDTFRVQASPLLLGVENSDSYFMGPSSGRGFIEALKRRLQEAGKPCSDFSIEAFLHIQGCHPLAPPHKQSEGVSTIPPRLFSDRCVNIYFQEWAPLFPALHKPTFLRTYEDWVSQPEKIKSNHKIAQLYLVFGIAALSSETLDLEHVAACEQQWQQSLQAILMDDTMETLQCLVLAMSYCQIRADSRRLLHYKSLAVGLSYRLGLHQSQKRFSFGALTIETRKKVFWALYTLDCFSAATLGLPKLIKEDDVHTEYPNDVDDEYVTEKGFLPTLPGESTRLSGALALFRASRILAKVLEKNYPAATAHELSLQQMSSLEAELDDWSKELAPHLKLNFKQDKPSTDVTGSRSPLLAIAYYFIRTLIYRPAIGSSLGAKAAPAVISVVESSKHIIQIIELLEERSMSFSFCLNKTDLLILCGMALLYQAVELKRESKMMKDNERLVNAVIQTVGRTQPLTAAYGFKRIASLLISVVDEPQQHSLPTPPGQSPDAEGLAAAQPAPQRTLSASTKAKKKLSQRAMPKQHSRSRQCSASETDLVQQQQFNRAGLPNLAPNQRQAARQQQVLQQQQQPYLTRRSFDGVLPEPISPAQQHRDDQQRLSMPQFGGGDGGFMMSPRQRQQQNTPPLDYLSLYGAQGNHPRSPAQMIEMIGPNGPTTTAAADVLSQRLYNSTVATAAQQPPQQQQKASEDGLSSLSDWQAMMEQMAGVGKETIYDFFDDDGGGGGGFQDTMAAIEDDWSPDPIAELATYNLGGDFGGLPQTTTTTTTTTATSLSDETLSRGGDDLSLLERLADFPVSHRHHHHHDDNDDDDDDDDLCGDGFTRTHDLDRPAIGGNWIG